METEGENIDNATAKARKIMRSIGDEGLKANNASGLTNWRPKEDSDRVKKVFWKYVEGKR